MKKDGKTVAKADLPSKICAACARPFTWRKRWERDWEQVRFCSDRCRAAKSTAHPGESGEPSPRGNGGG